MKLMVTGGAGYIGSVIVKTLILQGHQVEVCDDLSTGHRDAVDPAAVFHQLRISQAGEILDSSFDAVIHCAAKSLVAESVQHPQRYWEGNIVESMALLEAIRAAGVPRIVFSSTAAVYGNAEVPSITEDHPTAPTNPYGATKLAIDHMLTASAAAHGLAAVSLRYFNVAGAYGGLTERHDPETHLIPNLLGVAAGKAEWASVFGGEYPTADGTAVRDYLHVLDLADAHVQALGVASAGVHEIYNLGTGVGSSVLEVVAAVRAVTGCEVPVRVVPARAGDPVRLVASGKRAREVLGWVPSRGIEQMITDAWKAYPHRDLSQPAEKPQAPGMKPQPPEMKPQPAAKPEPSRTQ